jgi:mRNA interferase RelE/StbE
MFEAKFSNKSIKIIQRLEDKTKKRIQEKINLLCENPFPSDCVRVEGYKDYKVFRVRVGKYRIIYSIHREENLIVIINVDKRSRVYD